LKEKAKTVAIIPYPPASKLDHYEIDHPEIHEEVYMVMMAELTQLEQLHALDMTELS